MDSGRFLLRQYGYFVVELYHLERNHQGLDNRLLMRAETTVAKSGRVQTRRRLGGMLNYYYRAGRMISVFGPYGVHPIPKTPVALP